MEASFFTRHPLLKDLLSLIIFVICVVIGTILINSFVFRSYNVVGPSMESTMYTGDRLIVNRLSVTWAAIQGKTGDARALAAAVEARDRRVEPVVEAREIGRA